jgi:hypothetical protein
MEEKRKFQRIKILAPIMVKRKLGKDDAVAYDVSRGGICFVNPQIYEVGDACTIVIDCNEIHITKSGRIMWRGFVGSVDGMQKYGLQFDTILLENELEIIYKSSGKNPGKGRKK